MALFSFEQVEYFEHCCLKSGVEYISLSGFFPIGISQTHGKTKRIDLEFTLPHPGGHFRNIASAPMPIIRCLIKRIGVRIDMNILDMTFN
ncbi:hypothetical protein D3C76_1019650 [compost metagenome]